MRILIAEADRDTALSYKTALEKRNHQVSTTDNGEDCLRIYHEDFNKVTSTTDPTEHIQPFDAVVLDYKMPKINGMEVTKEILTVNPRQRIILATSVGIRPLADVVPFRIIGGHLSIYSPSPNVYVIVAQITDNGVQHAVIVDLKKTASGIPRETLYHTDLGQTITGTNPFTGKVDTISHITDLLLYNNINKSSVQFNDDSELTMSIIYK
jgi:CheY-like chemotaxis protein